MMNVCRVCLAMGVKMYHTSEKKLNVVYKQVTGVDINTEDKLPKMLCWECVARLSSAYNFIKKALKTHITLVDKMKSSGLISMDDLEVIDKTELKSTLGVKFYRDNYSYMHIMESDNCYENNDKKSSEPNYIDINDVEEQNYVPQDVVISNKDPVKSDYSDGTEAENDVETDISEASDETELQNMKIKTELLEMIATENAIVEKMLIDDKSNVSRMLKVRSHIMDDTTYLYDLKKENWKRKRSEALPHCKELRVVLEDVMLTLNKDNTQDTFKHLTDNAQTSKDNNEHFAQGTTNEKILFNDENNCSEILTFSTNNVKVSKYIDTPCENSGIRERRGSVDNNISAIHDGVGSSSKLLQKETSLLKNIQKQPNLAYKTSISKHTNISVFTCDYCTFETSAKSLLTHHTDTNHQKSSIKCAHCSFVTNIKDRLVTHNNSKHAEKMAYECSYCTLNTYFKCNLTRHMNLKHPKVNVFKCTFCSYKAYYKNTLTKHINAKHTKVYNCSHCNHKTYYKRYLKEHIKTKHTKSDIFNCSLCEYKTYNKRAFKGHISYKHTKTDVFNCSHCDYKTYTKRYLTKHINAKHTKTDVFKCSNSNTKNLKRHINVNHTKENVFICSYCNLKLYYKSELIRHIKTKHS